MTQKLESIQAGRGIAALVVALFHSILVIKQIYPDSQLLRIGQFGSAGVDFFFVLSGFLMMLVHRQDIGRPSRILSYFSKRLTRIYPIYWALCILFIPACLAFPFVAESGNKLSFGALFNSFFLVPHHGTRLIGVTWSLEYEVFFYLVFSTLLLSRRLGLLVFSTWIGTIVSISIFGGHQLDLHGIPNVSPWFLGFLSNVYCLEFIFGILAGYFYHKKSGLTTQKWLILCSLLVLLAVIVVDVTFRLNRQHLQLRALLYGSASTFIILSCAFTETSFSLRIPSVLKLVGAASYSIYLTHFPIIALLKALAKKAPFLHAAPSLLLFLTIPVIACIPGLFVYLLVEKPLLRRLSLFTGRRKTISLNQPAEDDKQDVAPSKTLEEQAIENTSIRYAGQ